MDNDSDPHYKECDIDRNGPALVGDPDLGFGGLQKFGDVLVNHTTLKIRSGTKVKDFCLVDSPGMIDSPTDHSSRSFPSSGSAKKLNSSNYDRGYDFAGVCRLVCIPHYLFIRHFPALPGASGGTQKGQT